MAPISMTMSDLEGHVMCLKSFWLPYLGYTADERPVVRALSHWNWRTSQGHSRHVHCNSGNISKTVQDGDVVTTTDH